ncbi:MAG: TetR/AcrR family transcriptional regulator [Clostridium sartagoforme]|nr:TetR/AcrR family transcriptional regulator [Clostridium sartagoforme]
MKLQEEILKGSIEVFKEKGIKFTMDDLSRNLGMSKRTLYEIVKSKEALLLDAIDDVFDNINKDKRKIYKDRTLNEVERLKSLMAFLPESLDIFDYTRIYEVKRFYPNVYEKIRFRLDEGWEEALELLNNCIEKGLIKPVNILLVKHMIIGCINELLENDFLYKENMDYKKTYKEVIDIIFKGIENN